MTESESATGSLPAQPTRLLGRADELQAALDQLLTGGARLLTLVGPGGVGKTSLAIAVAERAKAKEAFPDGVRFVDLAPVRDPALVPSAIRAALGIPSTDTRPVIEMLTEALTARRLLLLVDNCEHLLAAAPDIARLLAAAPGIAMLATSREPLRLRWERTMPLGPLEVPDPDLRHVPPLDVLAEIPAVALFLERARAARPDFTLTEENAPAVARLVVHLDGLPLAIELAAARAAMLGPSVLLRRLEQHLPLPAGSGVDAPERHRTLQAAIAWSHDLLTPQEQAIFRRLAVFAGGWTLEAAEEVTGCCDLDGDAAPDVLEALTSLAEKSLVQVTVQPSGEPRFRLLETIREHALTLLEASTEAQEVRRLHAAYFTALAAEAEPALRTAAQRAWLERLERDHDNIRAALRWLLDHGHAEEALHLTSAVGYFWWMRGYSSEARAWIREAIEAGGTGSPGAFAWAALIAYGQGDFDASWAEVERAVEVAQATGNRIYEGFTTALCGLVAVRRGDREAAFQYHDAAIEIATEAGDPWLLGAAHLQYGMTAGIRDVADAADKLITGREHLRVAGDPHHLLFVHGALGDVLGRLGRDDEAREAFRDALRVAAANSDLINVSYGTVFPLIYLAERGAADRVVPILAAFEGFVASIGHRRTPLGDAGYARAAAAARAQLGEAAAEEAWAAGRFTSTAELIRQATALFEELTAGPTDAIVPAPAGNGTAAGAATGAAGAAGASPGARSPLSPREQEVLALVAEGRSNREIAEALVVSENTVKYHVASLLNKLDAGSRAEAVTHAVARGLLTPAATA